MTLALTQIPGWPILLIAPAMVLGALASAWFHEPIGNALERWIDRLVQRIERRTLGLVEEGDRVADEEGENTVDDTLVCELCGSPNLYHGTSGCTLRCRRCGASAKRTFAPHQTDDPFELPVPTGWRWTSADED